MEAAEMLTDLYRYIATHLSQRVAHERQQSNGVRLNDLPLGLLDRVHLLSMRSWPETVAEKQRVAVVNAYEAYRAKVIG